MTQKIHNDLFFESHLLFFLVSPLSTVFFLFGNTNIFTSHANNAKVKLKERKQRRIKQPKQSSSNLIVVNILMVFRPKKKPQRTPATCSELQRKTWRVIYTCSQIKVLTVFSESTVRNDLQRAGDGAPGVRPPKTDRQTDGLQNRTPQFLSDKYTVPCTGVSKT